MMPHFIFLPTFLLITLFDVRSCTELYDVNMVNDIRYHLYCNWIIIQTCRKTDYPVVKLYQEIKSSTGVYVTIFKWEDLSTVAGWDVNFRPLVLVTCWSCRNCLKQINKFNNNGVIARFIWLAKKDNGTNTLRIPINCMFVLIEKNMHGYYTLSEVYRLHSKKIQNPIGNWSFQTGLSFTKVPLEERRSNFYGQTITTLVEPNNSLNVLFPVYEYYTYYFWDLSKRLNFTIKNTTDPEDPYEVSILLHWTDIKSSDSYIIPFYKIWQVIFFKDIGVSTQLDGYLKPFTKTVWIAAVAAVLLTGIFSYAVAKSLERITTNEKIRETIDFHIYQSLYIFLQRSGATSQFSSQNIIILTQWILSICLISFYSATFISFISVVIPEPPFRTVDDILKQKTHNIVSAKHLSAGTIDNLQRSPDVRLRRLYQNHFDPRRNLKDDPIREFCAKNNYIFVTSELHFKKLKNMPEYDYCRISDTYIKITVRYMSWSLNKGKKYQKIFEFYIWQLHSGGTLYDHFKKSRVFERLPQISTFRGITMEDTIILFIILIAGLLLSILVLILEIIYKKIQKIWSLKKKKKHNKRKSENQIQRKRMVFIKP